jgi:phospholipase C
MALRPRFASRLVLTLTLPTALAAGCQPPPGAAALKGWDAGAWDAAAPEAGQDDAGRCVTPIVDDPLAAARASCTFPAGVGVPETLPISEADRARIPIKHVVVVMKENRSFDHLFGSLHESGQPDAEPIPPSFTNLDKNGATVSPFRLDTTCVNNDPGHQWDEMHRQVNGGAMDGFVTNGADTTGTDGHFTMGFYGPDDFPFYYWLANTYAINDQHFAAARSGTWPNRNFLLLGTADGIKCTYCGYPNASTPTIFNELDAAGVSWAAYTDSDPFDGTLGWEAPHPGLYTFEQFQTDARAGTLPAVSFVDGIAFIQDEHPTADVQLGERWTRIVYDEVRKSPQWPETAMIWTYDEAGGFADHVPPSNHACIARPGNPADTPFFEQGVRVPLVVISPYARPHYVSHVAQDHTAITRFIEAVFGLPALTARDANSDALLDMFDFGCPPALLAAPGPPLSGMGRCGGDIRLTTDSSSYPSADSMSITVSFTGVASPNPHDRLGLYKYPRLQSDIPKDNNPLESIAWAYIGGGGHVAGGAPSSGQVTLDKTVLNAGMPWPLTPGLWVVWYQPATASGADGYAVVASVDIEVILSQ